MNGQMLVVALLLLAARPAGAVRVLPEAQRSVANDVLSSIVSAHTKQGDVSVDHRQLSNDVDVPLPSSPDGHEVKSLPLLSEGVFPTKHWAGLLPASGRGDKFLFYWLFAPDTSSHRGDLQDSDIPILVWLNGGPGCSSMDGLFLENGPLRFEQKDGSGPFHIVAAQHSWHKAPAYTLYIDQPVGTGLSFTTSRKYPKNDNEVNTDFYQFLQYFLNVHADKFVSDGRVNRPFYFSGESHAGHYIPSMMAFILDQNARVAAAAEQPATEETAIAQIYVPLSGAAIGNGWVDPFHQYAAADAAYGHGIIGRAQVAALAEKEKECQSLLNQKRYSSSVCFNLLDDIIGQSYGSKSDFKVSQYDIRKVESRRGARSFPPGHKTVETYLGGTGSAPGISSQTMQQALEAIHATPSRAAGQVYAECTNPPYDALSHQDGLGVVNEVVKVLDHDVVGENSVRLLFFNGVTDLICNHVGNEIMLEKLPWKHKEEWIKATRTAWKSKSQPGDNISGYIKEFQNLLYLKVMESGHMVPMDVPDVALDMMRLFMYGGDGAFQYSPQRLDRAVAKDSPSCTACKECPTNITNYDIDRLASMTSGEDDDVEEAANGNKNVSLGIGIGLGVAFLLLGFVLYRRSSNKGLLTPVASYDLEMRGGTYFDNPTAGGDDGGANGTTNFRER